MKGFVIVLTTVVVIESFVYHSLGIYRHILWIRKQRAKKSET